MKNFFFSAAILCAALSFTSCGNSKNGGDLTIDAKVENGNLVNSQVDEVRAVGYLDGEPIPVDIDNDGEIDYYDYPNVIIATAPFKNGGFKITLPKKIDERLIEPLIEDFTEGVPNVKISNKNVKGAMFERLEAFKNNKLVGTFESSYESGQTGAFPMYMFVDGNCNISGSFSETFGGYKMEETMDVNLKKGWNTVYVVHTEAGTTVTYNVTTKKPKYDFTWHFYGYYDYDKPQKSPIKSLNLLKKR